jgi:LemA protein
MVGLYIVIGIVVLLVLIVLGIYNSLVGKKNQVKNAFGGMDTMLKKRYDLIPNLVSTVQQYMTHERETLTEVTAMRAKAMSGNMDNDQKVDLDNKISGMLGGIMVAVENYPDLKASGNFNQLQRTLNEVEEQISAARRSYNASVTDYNNAIEMFPGNMMAPRMGYVRKTVFEIPETQRENVNVGALFGK